ncbi:MAG: hypothetical protein HKN89_10040 [Eudoraea sp.]|nr:hypothetical protein [Eudoraea sp.]
MTFVKLNPKHLVVCLGSLFMTMTTNAQDSLPYYTIPDAPEQYTAGSVISRMIDGLGFRYYWATEGLTDDNLSYKPSETNRTIGETVEHIYGLTNVILNAALKKPNDRRGSSETPSGFDEIRKATLKNLETASALMLASEALEEHKVIFVRETGTSDFPFWNMINGPIEDAVWHCGQVVSLRRAAGNPMPSGVSVFQGTKRN